MFDFLTNMFLNRGKYKKDSEAVIISCFYNPQNSPYRLLAFQKWYHSIKHLNHRIIECLIGDDAQSQLPKSSYIKQVHADSLLFHKETLLNQVIDDLPAEFKYVFWVDADVLFINNNWLVEGVEALQEANLVQPFEYCVHLERNKLKPTFDVDTYRSTVSDPEKRYKTLWRSFAANHVQSGNVLSGDRNYDRHGHVGFAWGARREILEKCPLYELALVGGADHILAHAAVDQIPHPCIEKGYADNLDDVLEWSHKFSCICSTGDKRIAYVPGDLYHIWHGDISNRKYLKRVQDFTGATKDMKRDEHGFYVAKEKKAAYVKKYYRQREVSDIYYGDFDGFDAGFFEDMGYMICDIANLFMQPSYQQDDPVQENTDNAWPDQGPTPDSAPQWPAQSPTPDSTPKDVDPDVLQDEGNFS